MRTSVLVYSAAAASVILVAIGPAFAASSRSPFELGDLSSFSEPSTSTSAQVVDSNGGVELQSLYSMPFSAAAVGAAGVGASNDGGRGYFTGKIGPMWFTDDLDELDTGFSIAVTYGFKILPFLALEFETGYFRGEESNGSTDVEVWGVPFLLNAKVSFPLLIFEIYGGGGLGAFYVNADVDTTGSHRQTDDFVFGGDLFLGVGLELGPVAVSVEGKYLATESAHFPGEDEKVQGFVLYFGAGLGF